jgi:hypothetical protein
MIREREVGSEVQTLGFGVLRVCWALGGDGECGVGRHTLEKGREEAILKKTTQDCEENRY